MTENITFIPEVDVLPFTCDMLYVGDGALTLTGDNYSYALFGPATQLGLTNSAKINAYNYNDFSRTVITLPARPNSARSAYGVATLKCNNNSYGLFAGGAVAPGEQPYTNDVDVIRVNDNGVFYHKYLQLSSKRNYLEGTTVSLNNTEYALFGGGEGPMSNDVDVFKCNDDGVFYHSLLHLPYKQGLHAAGTINSENKSYGIFFGGKTILPGDVSVNFKRNIAQIVELNDDGLYIKPDVINITNDENAQQHNSFIKLEKNNREYAIFGGGGAQLTGNNVGGAQTYNYFECNDEGVFYKDAFIIDGGNQSYNNDVGTGSTLNCHNRTFGLYFGYEDGVGAVSNLIRVVEMNDDGVLQNYDTFDMGRDLRASASTSNGETVFVGGGQTSSDPLTISNEVYCYQCRLAEIPCFTGDSIVLTDQGEIAICDVKEGIHTIRGMIIKQITRMRSLNLDNSDKLVLIKKNAMGNNKPNKDTYTTKKHLIYFNGKMIQAEKLTYVFDDVNIVPYQNEILYNVRLNTYSHMFVNGIKTETLHTRNIWAKK